MRLPRNRCLSLTLPLALCSALLVGCSSASKTQPIAGSSVAASPTTAKPVNADSAFAALEDRYGARLGLYVVDTGSGQTVSYRSGERFAFASTAKALAAGSLLQHQTDAQLDETVRYGKADLLSYAPVTSQHVDTGMPLRDVVAAPCSRATTPP